MEKFIAQVWSQNREYDFPSIYQSSAWEQAQMALLC